MHKKREIGLEIKTVSNLIKRRFIEGCEEDKRELTRTQSWIIRYIYINNDREIFQRDIEKEFQIRRSTATGLLQLLEKNGYILREFVSHDARLKKLVLTNKEIRIQENIEKRIEEIEGTLSKDLSEEEISTFYSIMDKIKKNIE